jgi:hypothetical protein
MQYTLDKTVVLVAATKAMKFNHWYDLEVQRVVDILSKPQANLITSVSLDDYIYELIEQYLEEV